MVYQLNRDRKKQASSGINRRGERLMVPGATARDAGGDLDLRFVW
jgi:hypothetical protein